MIRDYNDGSSLLYIGGRWSRDKYPLSKKRGKREGPARSVARGRRHPIRVTRFPNTPPWVIIRISMPQNSEKSSGKKYGEKVHSIRCCIARIASSKTSCEKHQENSLKGKRVQSTQPSSWVLDHPDWDFSDEFVKFLPWTLHLSKSHHTDSTHTPL